MSQEVKPEGEKIEEKNQFLGTIEDCGERAQYHNLVDILFVIDATGSMSWCISQMKKTVCKIMKKFSDKQYNIKFAIELYRDHPPQEYSYIQKHFDLRNQDDIIKVIDEECDVAGGGDTPEAVFDGLINGLKKTKWRVSSDGKTKSKRFLFHGCDAPPHGKEYGCTSSDPKWTENGAPSGYTRMNVKQLLDEYNVDYSLIKCGSQADTMATLFKQCFGERFKRQLEIKQESGGSKYYKGSLARKSSIKYMQEIEREQLGGSQCEDDEEDSVHSGVEVDKCVAYQSKLCVDQLDKAVEQKPSKSSIFSGIKAFFSGSQQKKAKASQPRVMNMKMKCADQPKKKKKKVVKKKQQKVAVQKQAKEGYSDNSSDQGKQGKPRSMASLVLSDIEDGIDRHFEQPEKKEKKVTKDI